MTTFHSLPHMTRRGFANDDKSEPQVIDCGAPVLAMREEDGTLIVTTTKGTFPVDIDKPSQ